MWLTNIFIDYVPMYNKFRTVSMTLVATGFSITLIAILALKEVFNPDRDKKTLKKPIYISAAITGGIALIFALIPSIAGDFVSPVDANYFQGNNAFFLETLPQDRADMLSSDAWRSLIFILLSAGVILLYATNKLKTYVAISIVGILFLADLVPVDRRYLNDDNFARKRRLDNLIEPTPADNFILQDKSDYRVLNASVDIFNDASPSYFHKNIGGYHAAKLRRYQELINMQIQGEIGQLFNAFGRAKSFEDIAPALDSLGVLNMLNMKYVIYNKDIQPLVNPYANGNVWLVQQVLVAKNADEEMKLVGEINTKTQMVVDKEFSNQLTLQYAKDTTAKISLESYKPNDLVYNFSSSTKQMAVFSEIYYDKGWNAYINGKKVPYIRANYLLRAMPLEAGQYKIEFKFEPDSYKYGNMMALISSIVLLLSILAFGFWYWKKSSKAA